jgi:protein-tyrosine-phosphatase/DNA-binding transcriptional ArsR family regulator
MSTEISEELAHRVARHRALSDPARLRILDALALGDLSPSEIQGRLAIASNLLAHHLQVLETNGLLARTRSEGDRRRSYVHLTPEAHQHTDAGVRSWGRVVFVCTANSARSQLAAALWRNASDIPVASAGTHPGPRVHPAARAVAERHRLRLGRSRPQHATDVLSDGDVIITVCDSARERLTGAVTLHWSVPDPVPAANESAFEAAFEDLRLRVDRTSRLAHRN